MHRAHSRSPASWLSQRGEWAPELWDRDSTPVSPAALRAPLPGLAQSSQDRVALLKAASAPDSGKYKAPGDLCGLVL